MLDLPAVPSARHDLAPKRNPKAPPFRQPAFPSRKCSICLHREVDTINRMLLGNLVRQDDRRYTLDDIAQWAALVGLNVSKAALSRHTVNHLRPPDVEVDTIPNPVGGSAGRHIHKAAEALVRGIFEEVRAEFAGAIQSAVEGVRELRPRVRVLPAEAPHAGPDAIPGKGGREEATTMPSKPLRARQTPRKGQRAMPSDFQAALKLEMILNRIQVMPAGMRRPLFEKTAADYGTDHRTVRRWLAAYEAHGLAGIMQARRSDRGQWRLPEATVRQLREIGETYPTLSMRKVYALIKETRPELLDYTRGSGETRQLSIATLSRIVRQERGSPDEPPEGP